MKANAREKKILYGGIVIAVAIMIYYAATSLSPGGDESLADKVAKQENLLRRQKELVGREDFYKKQIEDAEIGLEKIQTWLLSGNNAGTAGTELQRIIDDFAERSGIVILNKTPRSPIKVADSDTLTKISVQVGLDCMYEDLVDFLIAIKNYEKFLKVEEIRIDTQVTSPQRQYVIRRPLNVVISGYISVPPPESAAKPGEGVVQTTFRQ